MKHKEPVHDPGLVPAAGQIFLDHVGWFVPDMARTALDFERLGFRLTPLVQHRTGAGKGAKSKRTGTANRCVMLERGYLEILGTVKGVDTGLARQHRNAVDRYVGIHLIAFAVADAAAAARRLSSTGFSPADPVHLGREVAGQAGRIERARFTVVRVPPREMPEGRIQILTHETPDLTWQPNLVAGKNRISQLAGVLLCVDDPLEAAQRFGNFTECGWDGTWMHTTVRLDRGRLDFCTRERCAELLGDVSWSGGPPSIPAVSLNSRDLESSYSFFATRSVPLTKIQGGSFLVDPTAAMGAALVIQRSGRAWPPPP